MAYNKDIVERLSQFNNLSFTKKQWDIILKGCECPKSSHFWNALRVNNLQKNKRLYTLIDIDNEAFAQIWNRYCESNRAGAKKSYLKKKVRKKIQEKGPISLTFYMINGCLTTSKPERD